MKRGRIPALLAGAIAVLGLATGADASAAVVTVGSPIVGPVLEVGFGSVTTIANRTLGLPEAHATSPVSGAIVRWRIAGASGGPFRLRVLAPSANGAYTGAGTSAPEIPANSELQTFATALPIQAGQTIALNNNAAVGDQIGAIAIPGSSYMKWEPPLGDAQTLAPTYTSPTGIELTFNADVLPAPTVNLLNPASGSVSGGSSVGIAGTDFTDVKSVKFGNVPAKSFSVDSEALITAVAPAAVKAKPVDVVVTTIAGSSAVSAADRFTYTACVVPSLRHKKLKAARKALRRSGCRLGKVRRRADAGRGARVIRQSVKPRDVRPPGTRIGVKLG